MKKYTVKEIFYTLQGEGYNAGKAAVFCRFSGCNLWDGKEKNRENAICSFCDTDFVGTNGALGGKVIGAGGGGFILFIIDKRGKKELRKKLIKFKLNEFDWNFNMKGTSVSKL